MIHAETRPLFGSAINDFLEVPLVIRMGSIDNHLHVWTYRAFAFEDAKDLIGPVEFPARNVLAETPSLAQSLRLRQIHLAPPKPLLGLLAFRTFPGFAQRALEGGHRGRIDGFCDCGDRALSGHEISSGAGNRRRAGSPQNRARIHSGGCAQFQADHRCDGPGDQEREAERFRARNNPLDVAAEKLLVPAALSVLRGLRSKNEHSQ